MTRLFIRFYVGVLIVLFLAWYIHGWVTEKRSLAERARVTTTAHAGGARLVANELNAANSAGHENQILSELQERFDYQLSILPLGEIPEDAQRQLSSGVDVAYRENSVFAMLANGENVVRLGGFPSFRRKEIEASLAGWMQLAKEKLDVSNPADRSKPLAELRNQFEIAIEIARLAELPQWARQELSGGGGKVVFYSLGDERYFSAICLSDGYHFVRFGPFPSFEDIDQKAATTTLALVLLPAALAIALLLRPVARQLRQLENAAKTIAIGDLSARVDEQRMYSAKPLAQAFNHMAGRTESLVRTQRELLQAVSHELRTPLARMRFAIDLIGSAENEAERHERLESLDAATEELDALVGELISYVRMESAEPPMSREHIAVHELLDELIPKYSALRPSIAFRLDDQVGNREDDVFADRHGFQRAMGNLLSNAGRHAKSQVTILAESRNGTTTIDVDDDGSGIPSSERTRVFEPFVGLEQGTHGKAPGVGLGLALVQRIVKQHGGDVKVLESPLGGCRIRTTWPYESAATSNSTA